MSKKEELIKDMAEYFENAGLVLPEAIGRANWFYNKIRASILTPRVVALLKAIGQKSKNCCDCVFHESDIYDLSECRLGYHNSKCPLPTSEELKVLTE